MKRWINKKLRLLWLLKNMIKPMYHHIRGGWYVWRDSPDRVVRFYAAMHPLAVEKGDKDMIDFLRQAVEERKLRRDRKYLNL